MNICKELYNKNAIGNPFEFTFTKRNGDERVLNGTLVERHTDYVIVDEKGGLIRRINLNSINTSRELKWYDAIPDCGLLCYVWDDVVIHNQVALVVDYDEHSLYPFKTPNLVFKNAEPVPADTVHQLLQAKLESYGQ